MRSICGLLLILPVLAVLPIAETTAEAGTVMVPGAMGGNIPVNVTSMKESRFQTTVKQQYDYSCGSAALATLLTYHYEYPVREEEVFKDMYNAGNKKKIRQVGFSLLDMKNYLEKHEFIADGFKVSLDKMAFVGVPAIALLNMKGYRHFVVVKGLDDKEVLVGDPSAGTTILPRSEFEQMWNGILFLVRNKKNVAENYFNRKREWHMRREAAPLGAALSTGELANVTLLSAGRAAP